MLVSVLWKQNPWVSVCVYVCDLYKVIYCKEVAYVIMEAEKSDCGEPVIEFQSESEGMRSRKASGICSSPEAGENCHSASKTVRHREKFVT